MIKGKRIKLIRPEMEWLDDFHRYSTCEEFYKYMEYDKFKDIKESNEYFINRLMNSHSFLIIKNDVMIGTVILHSLDYRRKSISVGYGISPKYWGNGYFKETMELIIDYVFNVLNLHRLYLITSVENLPSINGAKHVGFKEEGIYLVGNEWKNGCIMSIIK